MVNLQSPVPLHGPDHPAKNAPALGVAFRDTTVPAGIAAVQLGLQLIPVGVLTTVPFDVPASCTVSWEVLAKALDVNENTSRQNAENTAESSYFDANLDKNLDKNKDKKDNLFPSLAVPIGNVEGLILGCGVRRLGCGLNGWHRNSYPNMQECAVFLLFVHFLPPTDPVNIAPTF